MCRFLQKRKRWVRVYRTFPFWAKVAPHLTYIISRFVRSAFEHSPGLLTSHIIGDYSPPLTSLLWRNQSAKKGIAHLNFVRVERKKKAHSQTRALRRSCRNHLDVVDRQQQAAGGLCKFGRGVVLTSFSCTNQAAASKENHHHRSIDQ